jgi:hypothetical protein
VAVASKSYLREYGFGGLLGYSFVIYVKYFVPLVAVVAIVELPPLVLGDIVLHLFPTNLPLVIFSVLFEALVAWAGLFPVIVEISDICLGNEVSVRRALRRISARSILQLFGTSLLSFLIPYVCFVVAFMLGVISLAFAPYLWLKISGGAIALAGVLAAVYLFVRYAFANQVVILEKKYWFHALRRSGQVVNKSWWRIALFWVLYGLFVFGPVLALSAGPEIIASAFRPQHTIMVEFYGTLAGVATTPLLAIFATLFYYSERIRKHDLTADALLEIKAFEVV